MSDEPVTTQKLEVNQPLETFIQIGLAALLVIGCLIIIKPFVPLIIWGIIIAIASYPTFLKLEKLLKGRRGLAAVIWTLVLLAILIIPLLLLAQNLVEGIRPMAARLREGTLVLPPPPPGVEQWPMIGRSLARIWGAASVSLTDVAIKFAPQIKSALPGILAASAGLGFIVLQFLLSILLSGALLANAESATKATRHLANRLFGEQGPEFQELIAATVRSVTFGILGVALIQSAFAAAGFFLFGLPGAHIWTFVFVIGAVLQMGGLVLIPAVDLLLRCRLHHESHHVPHLVRLRGRNGQRTQTLLPRARSFHSHRGDLHRGAGRFRCHGNRRPLRRSHRARRRLQALPGLDQRPPRQSGRRLDPLLGGKAHSPRGLATASNAPRRKQRQKRSALERLPDLKLLDCLVDLTGIEPMTSSMPWKRAPSCATGPLLGVLTVFSLTR